MFKTKLKHKKNGEIVDCMVCQLKNKEKIYYNPDDERETYNIDEYDEIPF